MKCQATGQLADFTIAEFEEKAIDVFQRALATVLTEKMHHIYIEFCSERLQLNSKFLNEERFNRLNEAFKMTHTKYGLSLELSVEWIEYLIKSNKTKEAISIIKETLAENKNSLKLWKLYLTIQIELTNSDNKSELIDLFNRAIKCVKQKEQLDLWKLLINWCLLNNYEKTEEILMVCLIIFCSNARNSFI